MTSTNTAPPNSPDVQDELNWKLLSADSKFTVMVSPVFTACLLVTVTVFVFLSVPMSLFVLGTRTRFCSAQSPSA